jgi:hypothetical protein
MYLLAPCREVRPVYNASHAVVVRVGITLTQIFDMVSTCCCYFFTLSATPRCQVKRII